MTEHHYRRGTDRRLLTGISLAAIAGSMLAGCQQGHVFTLTRPSEVTSCSAVVLREVESTSAMDDEYREHFREELSHMLSKLGVETVSGAGAPNSLTLEYRFVLYDAGYAPARVTAALINLSGVPTGSAGYGTLGVDAVFRDASGTDVGHIVADGPIDGFNGSTKSGLETAANSIARFASVNYVTPTRLRMASSGAAKGPPPAAVAP